MLKRIALLSLLLLAGCGLTSEGNLLRGAIQSQGREAAAQAVLDAEWTLCRAMPVGAVLDRYGRSQDTADAWRTLCRGSNEAKIIKAE